MSTNELVRKDYLIFVVVISTLVIASPLISNYGYFDVTKTVYGQSDSNQTNSSNGANLVNIQDVPVEKVHVGDIDVAYKVFGEGEPIIMFNGASDGMDAWDPALLTGLSSNHTVIVFDPRGIGNTTVGSNPYTRQQLANDTVGLLDALKIQKADVLGYSLGSSIAQQFAIMYPEKVNSLILAGASCGGKDDVPRLPEWVKLQAEIVNKSLNNIPLTTEEIKALNVASLGSGWIKLHPESLEGFENITSLQQLKPGLPPEIANNQNNVGLSWVNPNWSGACDELAKLDIPTLVITGTDDNYYVPHENALVIAGKIPGAWLVQIKDAGHAVMNQYPAEVAKIVNTFLSTSGQSS